ncbi:MAG TPA: hypothetical protein EYH49_05500 [Aquifex aeolicus]|nr:hypothetical protein [Aquifex aeolicus]
MPSLKEQWEATPLWQRALIVFVLPFTFVGALWFYVIKPDIERKEKLVSQKTELRKEIEKYRRMIRPGVLERLEKELEELKAVEEKRREELKEVVGVIPTVEEMERVFGEINAVALSQDLVITRIAVSDPQTRNFQLVEGKDGKFVKVLSQTNQKEGQKPPPGIPVTTATISMSLEGKTQNIYLFLQSLHRRGLVSYPKSVKIKPLKKDTVGADVVIDVILQK